MRSYYVLYRCDVHKSTASFYLAGVFCRTKLEKAIRELVRKGEMEFNEDLKCLNELELRQVNTNLVYGHIEDVILNELV